MVGWALSVLVVAGPAQAADCVEGVPASALEELARAVERDYVDGDEVAFAADLDGIRRRLPCVAERISPALAAHLHQVFGLAASVASRPAEAELSYAAARAASPESTWPAAFLPEGHEVDQAYERALVPSGAMVALPKVRGQTVYVDGRVVGEVLRAAPALLQQVDRDGAIVATRYRAPGEEVASAEGGTGPRPTGWYLGAGGALLTSAGLYAAGALLNRGVEDDVLAARDGAMDAAGSGEEVRRAARAGNVLVVASGGVGLVGSALCAVAVVRTEW